MDNIIFSNPAIMPSIPYSVCQYSLKQRTTLRPPHRHEHFAELAYITGGSGIYTIDGKSYPIKEGDILLYNKGSFHEIAPDSNNTVYHICFGLANLSLKGLPPGHMTKPGDGFVRPSGEKKNIIESLVKTLYENLQEKPSDLRSELSDALLKPLLLVSVNMPADERTEEMHHDDIIASNILSHINMHFTEELTLEKIGTELHISPSYASHIFKNCYDISPVQYMIRCRIGEAQNLLISTDYPIAEIAAIVGYNSCDHFKSIFKQKVGLSPGKYRSYARHEMILGKKIQ